MQTVWISSNPLDSTKWVEHHTHDVRALLVQEYKGEWPATARIYHQHIAQSHDVTPRDERSVESLAVLPGPFYVIVYPGDPGTLLTSIIIFAAVTIGTAIIEAFTDHKKPREHIFTAGSPNNALSDRSNAARLNQRIPDPFGLVRSFPDLIQFPYTIYENNDLVEYSYMCVARGPNATSEFRDGSTKIEDIIDAAVTVYPPGQVPGGTPSLVVGTLITEPVVVVNPVKQIKNQPLLPINAFYLYGSGVNVNDAALGDGDFAAMRFFYSGGDVGRILVPSNGDLSTVTDVLDIDDELQIIWGVVPTTANPKPNLSCGWAFGAEDPPGADDVTGSPNARGDLEPCVVTDVQLLNSALVEVTVQIPSGQIAEWAKINTYVGSSQGLVNRNVTICAQNRWPVGYLLGESLTRTGLFIDDPDMTELWMNFGAPQNLYMDDGVNRKVLTYKIAFFIQPCDADGIPTADPNESGVVNIVGSIVTSQNRGVTLKHTRGTVGRCLLLVVCTSFRTRKIDLPSSTHPFFRTQVHADDNAAVRAVGGVDVYTRTPYRGNISDLVQFEACYSISPATGFHTADVTTVQSRVVRNRSSSRLQERQLNCLSFRQVGTWNGTIFDTSTIDSQGFGENMLFHILKDPFICNRGNSEIDFAGIAAAFAAVRDNFGDEDATRFSYTFDDHNMSAEETIATLCAACFITPYRLGNVIKCDPDIATDSSSLLFNHRNKVPASETRSITFGIIGENDGVEQSYIDVDKGNDTFSPISQVNSQPTVVSPFKSRIVGLSKRHQAAWHAYRHLARMMFQHTTVEFEALEEAAVLPLKRRVLVEDNTRPDVQDGHVLSISGLVIRTSQPVVLAGGSTYTVFLQHPDETVEAIAVTAGPDGQSLTLGSAPATALITDPFLGVPTTYLLSRDQASQTKAFSITEKQHNSRMTYGLTAVNYSHMYYHADGLILFLPVSTEFGGEEMFDRSPYERPNNGTVADTTSDALRGPVYLGSFTSAGILVDSNTSAALTVGYTKACWINKELSTGTGSILSSTTTNDEHFEVDAAVVLRGGHSGSFQVSYTNGTSIEDIWIHAAMTYDVASQVMRLYFNGELVDEATGVANRSNSSLTAFRSQHASLGGRLIGKADNLRHYARVLSPSMIRELYQKELIVP